MKNENKQKFIEAVLKVSKDKTFQEIESSLNDYLQKIENQENVDGHFIKTITKDVVTYLSKNQNKIQIGEEDV